MPREVSRRTMKLGKFEDKWGGFNARLEVPGAASKPGSAENCQLTWLGGKLD
jgi:hypothetical protein